jgi:hypothetical protein
MSPALRCLRQLLCDVKILYSSEITFNQNFVRYRKPGETLKLVIIKKAYN